MGLLNSYLSWGYGPVNQRLRFGMPLRSKERALVEHVQSLMVPLAPEHVSEDNPLWRGVRLPTMWIDEGEWTDPAFVSTSKLKRIAENFADTACAHDEFLGEASCRACLVKIVDATWLHLDVNAMHERMGAALKNLTPSGGEREIILAPGTQFIVLDTGTQIQGPWPRQYAPLLLTVAAIGAGH